MIANVLVMGTLPGISGINILLNPRLKQLLLPIFSHQEANQLIASGDGAYAFGSAGEEQVAFLEAEELAHVADQRCEVKDHIAAMAVLHFFAVFLHPELDVVEVGEVFGGEELGAQRGGIIEAFGDFPGVAFTF
jgi:hypothetical protein